MFPVVGKVSYAHDHHDYPATDIITACGNEVRAVTSGVILEVNRVDKWKASVDAGATRGGLSVSIKGDDGVRYYGSHLEEINKNIQPGVRVTAGEAARQDRRDRRRERLPPALRHLAGLQGHRRLVDPARRDLALVVPGLVAHGRREVPGRGDHSLAEERTVARRSR